MVLSGDEIRIALANGQLVIDPLPASDAIKTSAVDLTLGDDFRRWRLPGQDVPGFVNRVDPSLEQFSFQRLAVLLETAPAETDGSVLLEPGAFLLGVTRENVELPIQSRLAARVEGRSSIARMGVGVHMTAPTIHAG